jgi:hypothetical protein
MSHWVTYFDFIAKNKIPSNSRFSLKKEKFFQFSKLRYLLNGDIYLKMTVLWIPCQAQNDIFSKS